MSLEDLEQAILALTRATGKPFITPYMEVPGITTGAVYAAGEAVGGKFTISVPRSGIITVAMMLDLDDEGKEMELWLFDGDFTATTDNTAFAVTDADLLKLAVPPISLVNFADANVNQVISNTGLALPFEAPLRELWCQCVTRDTPNIASGNIPLIRLAGFNYE